MKTLALLTLALAAAVPGSRFQVPGSGFSVPGSGFSVRFHHVHYEVADPSAAMAAAVAKLGGTRQIVSGLGVGVKIGDVFLLYDRDTESDVRILRPPSVADAYVEAMAWLQSRGVAVEGEGLTSGMVANAGASRYKHIAFAAADFDQVVAQLGRPLQRTADTALFDADDVLLEIVREELPDAFWCPMHPDERSGRKGKCPLCGMDLVPIPPPKIGEYKLDVLLQRAARGVNGLTLTVRDPETLEIVERFETVHEKLFHLFIVSRDLEYFAHVHPVQAKGGAFVLKHPLAPGEYMLIADFLPVGGTSQMLQRAVIVPPAPPRGVRSRFANLENRDLTPKETTVDGVRIRLQAEDVVPGKDACLTFTLTDANTGAPVADLEPFLGAPAHMLMVRSDLSDAIHAHPEELNTAGPRVSFHPLIPAEGDYRLWIQFQRAGRVITTSFDLRAARR